jgi:Zn-dependent protease
MMVQGILFNLVLAVFNLLPIPPLDGSHVMKWVLPPAWSLRYQQLGRYGIVILLVLLWTDIGRPFFTIWMKPVTFLAESAIRAVFPFFLKSPYGMGIG